MTILSAILLAGLGAEPHLAVMPQITYSGAAGDPMAKIKAIMYFTNTVGA